MNDLGWRELIIAVASAIVGWLANLLNVWRLPGGKAD
jgi:hypothetical protein